MGAGASKKDKKPHVPALMSRNTMKEEPNQSSSSLSKSFMGAMGKNHRELKFNEEESTNSMIHAYVTIVSTESEELRVRKADQTQ